MGKVLRNAHTFLTSHAFHASYNFVPLHMGINLSHTCVRSHASHTPCTCPHQRLLTHV